MYRAGDGTSHSTQTTAAHDAQVTLVCVRSGCDDLCRAALCKHDTELHALFLAERLKLANDSLALFQGV